MAGDPEPALDPVALFTVLSRRGVRYVVIGGVAAVLHGAPYQTVDCDITPQVDRDNLTRLSAALRELKARVWKGKQALAFDHDVSSLRDARIWNLVTSHGLLDITLVPSGTDGYDDLSRNAVDVAIDGLQISVASLADIVRSKQASNRDKDQRVLPLLRRMLADGIELE